jgi:hypothetical protein
MEYFIGPRDYLVRARARLSEAINEALFYAAFELRCGIEARLSEYLEAAEHVSRKKKSGWRVAELGRNVERAFKIGNKIACVAFHEEAAGNLIVRFYYTPVTPKLRNEAEKLGNYLHRAKKHHDADDPFWRTFRSELEDIASELDVASRGTLLAPPLRKGGSDLLDLKLQIPNTAEANAVMDRIYSRKNFGIRISYLDELPPEAMAQRHAWTIA